MYLCLPRCSDLFVYPNKLCYISFLCEGINRHDHRCRRFSCDLAIAVIRGIRYHRKRAGLSRVDLAAIAGVGKTVIYHIEHGKETIPFRSLARALDSPLMPAYHQEGALAKAVGE